MKKIILLLMLIAATITTSAQQTSLVIDNQTPGWLSSKINYEDQQTLVNLTVTGVLNKTDLEFINKLMKTYSLIIAKTKCAFFQNEMCIFCIFFAVSQLVLNGLLNGF